MNFELLVFDLDGTLVDSREDIAHTVNHVLALYHLSPLPDHAIAAYVGRGVASLVRSVLGEENRHLYKKAMPLFKAYYAEHLLDHTALYPGVRELLDSLEGYRKAVLTNKPTVYSVRILEGLGVAGFFEAVLGGDDVRAKKPAPDALIDLARQLHIAPEKMLMIGDSTVDIETGKNAGVKTCAVTYGFGEKEDLLRAGPDYILDSITDVRGILKARS